MSRFRIGRVCVLGLTAMLCAVALPASAPAATTSKPYTLNISPSSVPAGKATAVTATYKNTTGNQQLGSSNLTAPAGYTVTSASLPSGPQPTVSGSTIQLRNLALAPGNSVTVTIGIVPPCTSGAAAWSVITKQSNEFNGTGNDLSLNTKNSSLTTTTTGFCSLRFANQPATTGANHMITDTAYTPPPGGGPVRVEYVDGAGNRLNKADTITMSTSPSTTLDGTETVSMVNGLASFGDLSIPAAGDYRLVATGSGGDSTQSNQFHVDGFGMKCTENVDCSGTITNTAGTQTVHTEALSDANVTDATVLTMSFTPNHQIDCPGYTELAPDTALVDAPGRIKLVTLTLAASVVAGRSPSEPLQQSCIEAPYPFAPRLGTALTPVDEDGNGVDDHYLGLLPDCFDVTEGILYPPPCVDARGINLDGSQWIRSKLPAPDPWTR